MPRDSVAYLSFSAFLTLDFFFFFITALNYLFFVFIFVILPLHLTPTQLHLPPSICLSRVSRDIRNFFSLSLVCSMSAGALCYSYLGFRGLWQITAHPGISRRMYIFLFLSILLRVFFFQGAPECLGLGWMLDTWMYLVVEWSGKMKNYKIFWGVFWGCNKPISGENDFAPQTNNVSFYHYSELWVEMQRKS